MRLAADRGVDETRRPASAGMAVVLRWEHVLPDGYRVAGAGELVRSGKIVLRAGRQALTQLALGYRSVDDLMAAGEAEAREAEAGEAEAREAEAGEAEAGEAEAREAEAGEAEAGGGAGLERLRRDFPPGLPKYCVAPFYYWF